MPALPAVDPARVAAVPEAVALTAAVVVPEVAALTAVVAVPAAVEAATDGQASSQC